MNQPEIRTPIPRLMRLNAFNPDIETYTEYEARQIERRRLLNDAATPREVCETIQTKAGMTFDEITRLIVSTRRSA